MLEANAGAYPLAFQAAQLIRCPPCPRINDIDAMHMANGVQTFAIGRQARHIARFRQPHLEQI